MLTGIVVRETLQSFTERTLALGMQGTVSGMVRKTVGKNLPMARMEMHGTE